MFNKYAEQERQFSMQVVEAIRTGDTSKLNKYAAGLSDLLMYYSYTQGHARRIFGGLNGEPFEKIDQMDPKVIWEPERERVKIRYHLQPEYRQVETAAAPIQSWSAPYLKRVAAGVVEGYFSKIVSDEIIKKVEEVAAYPYDIVEFFKDQTLKQCLDTEDRAMYYGFNQLVGAVETTVGRNRSIYATNLDTFTNEDLINGVGLHIDAAKRNQPKEFMVMPELAYIQLAKLPQNLINQTSQRYFEEGFNAFGDKANTTLYDTKIVRVDDASWATYEYGSTRSKFGVDAASALAMYQAAGYNIAGAGDLDTYYGIAHADVDSFLRIHILPPRNFLGKVLLYGSDLKTNLKYENEYLSFYSTEWLAYILHNIYGVTCIDLWYKAH